MTKPLKIMRRSLFAVECDPIEIDSFDTYQEAAEDYMARLDEWVANIDSHGDAIHGGDDDQMLTSEAIVHTFKKQYYIEETAEHEAQMELALRYEDGEAVNC